MGEDGTRGMPGDGTGSAAGDGEWLSVAAAARRLGVTPRSVRGRIARGTLVWKPNGNAGKLVRVPFWAQPGGGPEDVPGDAPGGSLGVDALELELLRGELTEALVAAARAEERAVALQSQLDREVARADRLEARLARPWWSRWRG